MNFASFNSASRILWKEIVSSIIWYEMLSAIKEAREDK